MSLFCCSRPLMRHALGRAVPSLPSHPATTSWSPRTFQFMPCPNSQLFSRALSSSASSSPNEKPQKLDDAGGWGGFNFNQWMATNYPRLYKLQRLAIDGSKSCFHDLKTYYILSRGLRSGRITYDDFNAQDMLVYLQVPSESVHLLVLLILLQIPVVGEAIIVTAFVAPRLVLTRHFWTDEQSRQFQMAELAHHQRAHFPAIVGSLKLVNPKAPIDRLPLPMDQLITGGKQMMATIPVLPDQLTWKHQLALKRLHGLRFWSSGESLLKRARLLQLLDAKMADEGDRQKLLSNLGLRELRTHLYLRKLNYEGMTAGQMRATLDRWLDQFKNASACDPLLYAHAPVLAQAHAGDAERWSRQQQRPLMAMPEIKKAGMDKLKQYTEVEQWKQKWGEVDWAEKGKQCKKISSKLARAGGKLATDVWPVVRKGAESAGEAVRKTLKK